MSKVAVLGAGAIGCVYGVRLCNLERHDVVLCVRQSFDRLYVETPTGVIESSAHCLEDPAAAKPVDWVLLAVKCHQIKDVAPWLRSLVGPGTIIAVLQNGVEYVENVSPYANGATVLPVVVQCPADRLAPGRVVQNARAKLVAPDNAQGRALRDLFEGSDVEVETTSDFVTEMWLKLCGNIARNPATALTGRCRGVIRRPEVAEFCRALVRECAAVGRAEGANLPEDIAEKVVAQQFLAREDATTSMLVDVRGGRPLEADGMTGAVVRIGARHGISTPITRYVNGLLSAINVE
ncbi:2-dehydropantoate 2-reductase [Nitrospinota bacterium]